MNIFDDLRDAMKTQAKQVMEKYRLRIGSDIIERVLQTIDEERQYNDDELVIAPDLI